MARPREREEQRQIALDRIRILLGQAELLAGVDSEAAKRRVKMARSISLRCNVRMPREQKVRFCQSCMAYFTSATLRCRLDPREHRVTMTCLICKHTEYVPYVREKRRRAKITSYAIPS